MIYVSERWCHIEWTGSTRTYKDDGDRPGAVALEASGIGRVSGLGPVWIVKVAGCAGNMFEDLVFEYAEAHDDGC